MISADCHYGDHYWDGSSICSQCGKRLRCSCGCYVREDNLEKHMETCRWVAKNFEDTEAA